MSCTHGKLGLTDIKFEIMNCEQQERRKRRREGAQVAGRVGVGSGRRERGQAWAGVGLALGIKSPPWGSHTQAPGVNDQGPCF